MRLRTAVAILATFLHAGALCAPATPNDNEEFFVQQIGLVMNTLVEYCAVAAPETGPSLEHGLGEFNARLRAAAAPVMDRLRAQGGFDARDPLDDTARSAAKLKQAMVADLENVEPHAYCRRLVMKLRAADAQALVDNAEKSYLKFMATAKGRPAQGK